VLVTHPRLSVSEICTYPLRLADELQLWSELGVRHVGVLTAKLDAHGRPAAVAALRDRSMSAVTVITGHFDLASPATWDGTRAAVNDAVDLATVIGGCVYLTPGRRDGRSFDELTASLSEAVAPCARYAEARGVRVAIEPSLRTDVSYVHTLRDGLEVAERAGIDVIADLGNCWMERDYEKTVRRAGSRIAAVQFADAVFGTAGQPPPGGRAVVGDGDLPVRRFLEAALEAGYEGPFELEQVGPLIEAEGHAPALRRGVARANALLEELLR
jgi:sugar phosphate isomerase/epimerase